MIKLKPALQESTGRSKPWSGASLINCFSEKADGDKREDFAVMATPGLTLFSTASSAKTRGFHVMGGVPYIVAGTKLYSIAGDGTPTMLATIPGADRVRMADNGTELGIVAATVGYVWTGTALVRPVDLPPVMDVAFIDGYFVWLSSQFPQFVITGPEDVTSYNGDIATIEGSPDMVVGVINDHRELQFYKQRTIEIWYNSGAADFPFERQGNAFIERGCWGRDTIVKVDNSIHFLGDDLIVYRLDGYTPTRISTHAIEYRLRNITDAWAFTYTQEGHKFYCLQTDQGCLCYDMATGAWHERRSFDLATWRVGFADTAYGGTLLVDAFSGKIYRPSLDIHDENGSPISVTIGLPTIDSGDRRRVCMYAFELMVDTGEGTDDPSYEPQAMLRYSDDGGRLWSHEAWRSLGRTGDYTRRAIWRRLGQFRQRQMEITITDPTQRIVFGYYASIQ